MDKKKIIISLATIIIIIGIGAVAYKLSTNKSDRFEAENYQAIFLSNGQVYFGKIQRQDPGYVTLTDIYYLRATKPLQSSLVETEKAEQSDLTLVKLGSELHGPQDRMDINQEHILFIEELKADSKVNQAILNYKK